MADCILMKTRLPISRTVEGNLRILDWREKEIIRKWDGDGNASTAAGLAQSVVCLTAEREVAGSISWAGPILRFLK